MLICMKWVLQLQASSDLLGSLRSHDPGIGSFGCEDIAAVVEESFARSSSPPLLLSAFPEPDQWVYLEFSSCCLSQGYVSPRSGLADAIAAYSVYREFWESLGDPFLNGPSKQAFFVRPRHVKHVGRRSFCLVLRPQHSTGTMVVSSKDKRS